LERRPDEHSQGHQNWLHVQSQVIPDSCHAVFKEGCLESTDDFHWIPEVVLWGRSLSIQIRDLRFRVYFGRRKLDYGTYLLRRVIYKGNVLCDACCPLQAGVTFQWVKRR
jgi:hypothetical protein